MKNKSYIGISLIILVFGIIFVPKIVNRIKDGTVVKNDRMSEGNNKKIDTTLQIIRQAPKFELTNQNNKKITNQDYAGKVYVLEFFFSTCPSICPIMNKNMLVLEKEFIKDKDFAIASITINPANDTSEVLKKHAQDLGVTSVNWNFLTGNKDYIYNIANNGFYLGVGENAKANGGFEHSGMFALIDKKGNIRCRKDKNNNPVLYYDGLVKSGVDAIKEDIKKLLEE
ncbi:SCO family protein [Flavobacterium sp.]|uniref:SCO family protein n=1 Tax=Flavobacterium sp. TaxID=239 RepID=UPI00375372F0